MNSHGDNYIWGGLKLGINEGVLLNRVARVHPGALWELHRMRKFHLSVRASKHIIIMKNILPFWKLVILSPISRKRICLQLTLSGLQKCTRKEFYALRNHLATSRPQTFVVQPPLGRRRAAACMDLTEPVLECVNTSQAFGLYAVTSMCFHTRRKRKFNLER